MTDATIYMLIGMGLAVPPSVWFGIQIGGMRERDRPRTESVRNQ